MKANGIYDYESEYPRLTATVYFVALFVIVLALVLLL